MLTLRLKPGEYLVIGKDITVQVFEKNATIWKWRWKRQRTCWCFAGKSMSKITLGPRSLAYAHL